MFRKILGIIVAIAVAGTIVMVAITPRKEGFFPDRLKIPEKFRISLTKPDTLKKTEHQSHREPVEAIEEAAAEQEGRMESEIPADTILTAPPPDSIDGQRQAEDR